MAEFSENNDNKHRIEPKLDDALQRELDEALGGQSLDEIIAAETAAASARAPAKGSAAGVKRGAVAAIHGDDIFIDMGGKSQGILPAAQFADEPLPKVGDTVEFTIEGFDDREGLLMLSRQGAVMAATWQSLEEGQMLEGRVTGLNKGGLEMVINGIKAFMPLSQIDMYRVEDASVFLNQKIRVQVIEVDQAEQRVIVSRRALLELEAQEAREKAFETLVEGATVTGVVRSIMPYGAFVSSG